MTEVVSLLDWQRTRRVSDFSHVSIRARVGDHGLRFDVGLMGCEEIGGFVPNQPVGVCWSWRGALALAIWAGAEQGAIPLIDRAILDHGDLGTLNPPAERVRVGPAVRGVHHVFVAPECQAWRAVYREDLPVVEALEAAQELGVRLGLPFDGGDDRDGVA